jgi:hypothetical protein
MVPVVFSHEIPIPLPLPPGAQASCCRLYSSIACWALWQLPDTLLVVPRFPTMDYHNPQ